MSQMIENQVESIGARFVTRNAEDVWRLLLGLLGVLFSTGAFFVFRSGGYIFDFLVAHMGEDPWSGFLAVIALVVLLVTLAGVVGSLFLGMWSAAQIIKALCGITSAERSGSRV